MKDFDFDELDRAVNSVLTNKSKKPADETTSTQPVVNDESTDSQTVPVVRASEIADTPEQRPDDTAVSPESHDETPVPEHSESPDASEETTAAPITAFEPTVSLDDIPAPAPREETEAEDTLPAVEEPSESPDVVADDAPAASTEELPEPHEPTESNHTDEESSSATDEEQVDVPTAPVKRGRFMDLVAPGTKSNEDSAGESASRTGITIQPRPDFETESTEADQTTLDDENNNSPQQHSTDLDSEARLDEMVAGDIAVEVVTQEENTNEKAEGVAEPTDITAFGAQPSPDASSTPFIADVPVEKRPLNAFAGSEQTPEAETSKEGDHTSNDNSTEDAELSEPKNVEVNVATIPKEFNQEIMAVEANENVAAAALPQDAAHEESQASANHPLFDTSDSVHAVHAQHHTPSAMTWVIIIASLLLVGAALGVLYFLYGQA